MRLALVVCTVLAGCYAPTVPATGAPCDPAIDNCPVGQRCQAQGAGYVCGGTGVAIDAPMLDAPTIDGPPGDNDGDGVANAVDNCVDKANPTQHDEDLDGSGDVCDPCPWSSVQLDSDGDGVANPCDPNPNEDGDAIVRFAGFEQGIPTGWTRIGGGSWAAGNDVVALSSASGVNGALEIDLAATSQMTVVTSFVVTALHGGEAAIGAGNPYVDTDNAILCDLYSDSNGGARQLSLYNDYANNQLDSEPYDWSPGNRYMLRLTRDGTAFACVLTAGLTGKTTTGVAVIPPGATKIGLGSLGISATFEWAMVVTSAP